MAKPPSRDGQYLGEVEENERAVWVWTATGWRRDEQPPTGTRPFDRTSGPDEL
jgi:hypothetical protein